MLNKIYFEKKNSCLAQVLKHIGMFIIIVLSKICITLTYMFSIFITRRCHDLFSNLIREENIFTLSPLCLNQFKMISDTCTYMSRQSCSLISKQSLGCNSKPVVQYMHVKESKWLKFFVRKARINGLYLTVYHVLTLVGCQTFLCIQTDQEVISVSKLFQMTNENTPQSQSRPSIGWMKTAL